MIVLGLTGSIGMGKTAAARAFVSLGIPVFEADAVVHELLDPGGEALAAVARAFPTVLAPTALGAGRIDRAALGALVFNDPSALRRLEAVLHPLVRARERVFRRAAAARGAWVAVLDIPLLYEVGAARRCDYVAVVTAPASIQRARVLRRPGMTEARYTAILAQQMSDGAKRRRADFVIDTGAGRRRTLQRIRAIVRMLRVAGHRGRRRWGRARRRHARVSNRQCEKLS